MTARVIIIGGGISGLSAAWRLHCRGVPFVLLEAAPHPGGLIRSIREAGFLTESGPNTFPSHAEELRDLCRELGLSPVAARSHAKKRYLWIHGRLAALPMNPLEAVRSPILSAKGKLRLLLEPFQPAGPSEETSLADFMARRVGQEAVDCLIDPMISGIYAGDIHRLSASAVFPALWRWEQTYGSLLKGALQARKNKRSSGGKRSPLTLMSFSEGMETLPQAMVRALPQDSLRFGERVLTVTRAEANAGRFEISTETGAMWEAFALIIATPADVAARLIQSFAPEIARILSDIPYNGLTVTHLGFPESAILHPLDGFGCLIPRREKVSLLGSIWSSSLFGNRTPDGCVLLSNFLGGAHLPEAVEWEPERVRQTVLDGLQAIFQTSQPLSPVYSRVLVYPRAIPQYYLGHSQKIQHLNTLCEQYPGLAFCGNYLTGVALNECVKSGFSAAKHAYGPE